MRGHRLISIAVAAALSAGVLSAVSAIAAPAAAGCPATAGSIPRGADTATIADVDGDGRRDVEYHTEALPGGGFDYGIETASGHLARLHETLPGPGDHGGWTARIVHGAVVTMVDDGRSARLYSFRGCGFRPVRNAQGGQYVFSIAGFTGSGTGVACAARRGGPWLFGELASQRADGRWDVTSTHVVVAAGGGSARNGARATVGRNLAYTDRPVRTAFRSSCGAVVRVASSGN